MLKNEVPYDYEKFCEIKDKITLSNEISNINTGCFFCNNIDHQFCKCSYI